ncbi:hypothetical protein [Prevotella sp. E13-27]|uniref:hypothetical protein n=1 Tax=Prevotella sp. E13-27 TaxID=2938122 RepID=UPI00200B2AED|nr:hypothetical protein [Prevotella sp. E13-27]MCK8622542.1 hypothetical protein [Prevotella sp. E13-27]
MEKPSIITVQQLLTIANGLHIPVRHFFSTGCDNIISHRDYYIKEPYLPCHYDANALQEIVSKRPDITWQKAADATGVTRDNLRKSLLGDSRTPITRFLAACNALDVDPFAIIVDPNMEESKEPNSCTDLSKTSLTTLSKELLAMRKEMTRLKAQLFNTNIELTNLRRNQNTENVIKNKILAPVTWFYGIHFLYSYNDMSEPVRAWFQMLVAKEHPHYAFFFAKNGSEFKSVRFYTDKGIIFFEAECESGLANYLYSEKIMVGKILANTLEDNSDMVEFKADLVANLREDREDMVELAKFRKEMIQKFG